MELTTKVEIPKYSHTISHTDGILMLGSCFAGNMGRFMSEYKFKVDINPFGVQYNPMSVAEAISQIIINKTYGDEDLFKYNELWHSNMHHSDFSSKEKQEVVNKINNRILQAHNKLKQTEWVIVTFGTSFVYREKESNRLVSNCHKRPEREFIRTILTVEEIVSKYSTIISRLKEVNTNIKVLFTVSPIRHTKDGMHGNQVSKATLLIAVDEIIRNNSDCAYYFPSYELMMDELRDYRFYCDDFVHPTEFAIRYIWEKFSNSLFDDDTKKTITKIDEINKNLNHRAFNPNTEAHKRFLQNTKKKIESLTKEKPTLDFSKEIERCHTI